MSNWNHETIRKNLIAVAQRLSLRQPQVQLLLCQERFIARLGRLEEGKHFVWKGGSLVLRLYQGLKVPRFTVDIDLLARGVDIEGATPIVERAIGLDLHDGFTFGTFTVNAMERVTPYGGERFAIDWKLFGRNQSQSLDIDICIGDDVDSKEVDSSSVFFLPAREEHIALSVYPSEFIFAEKLETLVRFGTGNTRFKDLIDMWGLINCKLDTKRTKTAVERCFQRRNTPLSPKEWENVLGDSSFLRVMEQRRAARYAALDLPPASQMFSEIISFLRSALH